MCTCCSAGCGGASHIPRVRCLLIWGHHVVSALTHMTVCRRLTCFLCVDSTPMQSIAQPVSLERCTDREQWACVRYDLCRAGKCRQAHLHTSTTQQDAHSGIRTSRPSNHTTGLRQRTYRSCKGTHVPPPQQLSSKAKVVFCSLPGGVPWRLIP